jgi:hypothetical protein
MCVTVSVMEDPGAIMAFATSFQLTDIAFVLLDIFFVLYFYFIFMHLQSEVRQVIELIISPHISVYTTSGVPAPAPPLPPPS